MAYRVLMVDDFKMARMVFENAIEMSDEFELVGSFSNAEDAIAFIKNSRVDLCLMDVVMLEGQDGLAASQKIKEMRPQIKILVVTAMPEVSYIERARDIGIESFWYKEVQEQPILEVMKRTMAGESVYPDSLPTVTLGNAVSTDFTDKEIMVLRELVSGESNGEIASTLAISERTVKMHISNMLSKTGFRSRLELAVKARTGGLVIND